MYPNKRVSKRHLGRVLFGKYTTKLSFCLSITLSREKGPSRRACNDFTYSGVLFVEVAVLINLATVHNQIRPTCTLLEALSKYCCSGVKPHQAINH